MLKVDDLHAFYGKAHILQGISLEVQEGEIVTLLGRNGAGKTTTLSCIAGLLRNKKGQIVLRGKCLQDEPSFRVNRAGVSFVPEHRGIFRLLSVEENLAIAIRKGSRWSLPDVYRMFPRLAERRRNSGSELSGGEQQMLSIARALLNAPDLLLLDEPAEGLAPVIVDVLRDVVEQVRARGVAVLLVEQNLRFCMALADRHYIIEQGRIAWQGNAEQFAGAQDVQDRFLALGGSSGKALAAGKESP